AAGLQDLRMPEKPESRRLPMSRPRRYRPGANWHGIHPTNGLGETTQTRAVHSAVLSNPSFASQMFTQVTINASGDVLDLYQCRWVLTAFLCCWIPSPRGLAAKHAQEIA